MYPDSNLFYIINYKHIKLQSGMVIFFIILNNDNKYG